MRTVLAGVLSSPLRGLLPHLHSFRRAGDDPFSSASHYACRCGVVRAGF